MLCNCFEDYFADYYCMAFFTIAVSRTRFMGVSSAPIYFASR